MIEYKKIKEDILGRLAISRMLPVNIKEDLAKRLKEI